MARTEGDTRDLASRSLRRTLVRAVGVGLFTRMLDGDLDSTDVDPAFTAHRADDTRNPLRCAMTDLRDPRSVRLRNCQQRAPHRPTPRAPSWQATHSGGIRTRNARRPIQKR